MYQLFAHWNGNTILKMFSVLAVPRVVKTGTSGAVVGNNLNTVIIFPTFLKTVHLDHWRKLCTTDRIFVLVEVPPPLNYVLHFFVGGLIIVCNRLSWRRWPTYGRDVVNYWYQRVCATSVGHPNWPAAVSFGMLAQWLILSCLIFLLNKISSDILP